MTENGKDDLVARWQDVITLWDDLQALQANTEMQLQNPDLSSAERERYQAEAADIAQQLTGAKQKIDAIVRQARQGRVGRTGDFVTAVLGHNLTSDAAHPRDDTPGVSSRR